MEAGPPKVHDVEVTLRYPIELEAAETVAITPVSVSGFLKRVLVDVGDKVKSGQLIAVVDCREYSAQRTQAEMVIERRSAQVDETRTRFDRLLSMGEGKLVAPAEIDRAQAEARIAEAQLADAKAKLSEAAQRQGYCSLTSPFDGFVSERFLDPGAMVSPGGRSVVNIVKTRDVTAIAYVVERDATKIARGSEVDLVLHALPDTPLRAEVARTGRSLDPVTRTLRVEIDLPNTTERLLPGMTGRAAIVVDKRDDALLVPVSAVLKLEEVAYAYVVQQGEDGQLRAHRVEVELGVDYGDWLEVRKGLSKDDQVIMIGRALVDEGTLVEPVEWTSRPRAAPTPELPTPEPRAPSVEPEEVAAAIDLPSEGGTSGDAPGDAELDAKQEGAAADVEPEAPPRTVRSKRKPKETRSKRASTVPRKKEAAPSPETDGSTGGRATQASDAGDSGSRDKEEADANEAARPPGDVEVPNAASKTPSERDPVTQGSTNTTSSS